MTIAGPPNTQRPREHLRPSSPRVTALSTVTSASTCLFPRSPPPLRTSVPHATQQAALCASHRPSPVSISGSTISATTTISVLGFDAVSPGVPPRCLAFARRFRPCSSVSHRSTNGWVSVPQAERAPAQSAGPGLPVTASTRRHRLPPPGRTDFRRPPPRSMSESRPSAELTIGPERFPGLASRTGSTPLPSRSTSDSVHVPNGELHVAVKPNDRFGNL